MKVRKVSGEELFSILPALAQLRIKVFRTYPYLYAGSLSYEESYLSVFSSVRDACVIVAETDDGQIVGCATGSAITGHHSEFSRALTDQGIDLSDVFYFSESVLLPDHRGKGTGHAFFDLRENHAHARNYKRTCFCAVERPEDHPLRPTSYSQLDAFWTRRGYTKHPRLTANFNWPEEPDGPGLSHKMSFWFHTL